LSGQNQKNISAKPISSFSVPGIKLKDSENTKYDSDAGATVSYSRFGTADTTHGSSITAANDFLLSGDLEVDGDAFFDGTVNFVGIASSNFFYANAGTAASPSFSFSVDQDTGMFRPADNQLGFSTLGAERIRISDGGNIGIGTINLTEKLEVVGNASLSGDIQINGDDILSSAAAIALSISNDDASVVGCLNVGSATECTSQGNVEASGVLDINGGGTSDIAGTLNLSGNVLTATTDLTINPTGGQVLFADGDTFAIGGVAGQNYNIISDTGTSNHGLISDNDLFIEGDLEVDSDVWFDANASISGNLEVTGNITASSLFLSVNASISNNLEVSGVIKASDGSATLPSYTFENDANTGLYRVGTDTLGITSNGIHAASISGTTIESTTFKGSTYTGDGAVSINTGSGDLTLDANSNNVIISANASISNNFEVGSNVFYVNQSGGNVGIGTQNLTTALEIVGAVSISSELNIYGGLEVGKGTATDVAYSRFGTADTTHAGSITASNDLLISGDLEVNGSVAFDGFTLLTNASTSGDFETNTLRVSTISRDSGVITISNNVSASQNFEIIGYTSASQVFGAGLVTCSNESTTDKSVRISF